MHLILTHSIDRSKYSRRKRQVVLNNGFRYLCSLIMLCRPSTLGPPDQFTLESGEYPRLRDLKFFRTAAGTWAIEVTLKHFKGAFRSTNSKQIKFTLRSVHMAHNVVLDPTTWGIMYLFSRNAFEKKYKSVMEIFTDDSAELKIDPAMLDEPLFLRAFPSANGLTDQPALGRAATSSLNNDCAAVGLPRTGITAFRRGGANHLHMMIGASFTSDIMNHTTKESTILKQYYSQNTNNWEVVQLMLNEVKGEREAFAGEVKKWENERALFSSAAVNTLVGHKAIKTHLERVAEQRKEREARILQDPKVIAIDQRINDFWEESFEPCFSGDKAQRPRVRQNVSKLMKDAADEDYPDTEFVDKEEAEEVCICHFLIINICSKSIGL
ncbi:hypothetical protein BJ165DRAFT_627768 [Panaeolus papilionaceus]|nr:hypothetical protein BJ165DRAFT_627768 [Panaeolus papilionaceus]